MAILLAEILGASPQCGCQLQKAGMPLIDAVSFQPAVVPVVAMRGLKSFPDSCCQWVGVSPAGNQ
jgi:hypothetical protein